MSVRALPTHVIVSRMFVEVVSSINLAARSKVKHDGVGFVERPESRNSLRVKDASMYII